MIVDENVSEVFIDHPYKSGWMLKTVLFEKIGANGLEEFDASDFTEHERQDD